MWLWIYYITVYTEESLRKSYIGYLHIYNQTFIINSLLVQELNFSKIKIIILVNQIIYLFDFVKLFYLLGHYGQAVQFLHLTFYFLWICYLTSKKQIWSQQLHKCFLKVKRQALVKSTNFSVTSDKTSNNHDSSGIHSNSDNHDNTLSVISTY